uniref:Primase/helicase n=1 Tax=uncultured marine virus TaxID=186617 RepID=A0A0F7LAD2_9VIRU|nr:primase/helicase [uncultured marine virus]
MEGHSTDCFTNKSRLGVSILITYFSSCIAIYLVVVGTELSKLKGTVRLPD